MAEEKSNKTHVSIVICGHVDAGKSTTTGRLIFELGGINERELTKLKEEAAKLNKASFAFAFYMDRQAEERARGVTISCTTKEFYTDSYHYTIIDAPGHRDFIKNMITGASQADVALLMVPADGNFTASIAKGNHKTGEVQGQTRQHARLINLLGCKQLIVGVNKMDIAIGGPYSKDRYEEVRNEVLDTLAKVGWNKKFVKNSVPILPISGWKGDNLLTKSDNMSWWSGVDVSFGDKKKDPENYRKLKIVTLLDAFEKMVTIPTRDETSSARCPISGVYKIKGVGDVLTGRVEQGLIKPGDEVIFVPTHTAANPCTGKVFTVEMHHKNAEKAGAGDNVGLNVKGLDKQNMPHVGDVMIKKGDSTLSGVSTFTAQVQILDHPGKLTVGYTPIAYIRTGRSPVRMSEIVWKVGKETGGQKAPSPKYVKRNEMAEIKFQPQQAFAVETFKSCEGLGRIAIMEGNSVVMLGKVINVEFGPVIKPDKKSAGKK